MIPPTKLNRPNQSWACTTVLAASVLVTLPESSVPEVPGRAFDWMALVVKGVIPGGGLGKVSTTLPLPTVSVLPAATWAKVVLLTLTRERTPIKPKLSELPPEISTEKPKTAVSASTSRLLAYNRTAGLMMAVTSSL